MAAPVLRSYWVSFPGTSQRIKVASSAEDVSDLMMDIKRVQRVLELPYPQGAFTLSVDMVNDLLVIDAERKPKPLALNSEQTIADVVASLETVVASLETTATGPIVVNKISIKVVLVPTGESWGYSVAVCAGSIAGYYAPVVTLHAQTLVMGVIVSFAAGAAAGSGGGGAGESPNCVVLLL